MAGPINGINAPIIAPYAAAPATPNALSVPDPFSTPNDSLKKLPVLAPPVKAPKIVPSVLLLPASCASVNPCIAPKSTPTAGPIAFPTVKPTFPKTLVNVGVILPIIFPRPFVNPFIAVVVAFAKPLATLVNLLFIAGPSTLKISLAKNTFLPKNASPFKTAKLNNINPEPIVSITLPKIPLKDDRIVSLS